MKWKEYEDTRNYNQEANELTKKLSPNQCYELYDIVLKKLKRSNSETRDKELSAVKESIERKKNIDIYRLRSIKNGYKSEMAQTARAKDGQARVSRKKV